MVKTTSRHKKLENDLCLEFRAGGLFLLAILFLKNRCKKEKKQKNGKDEISQIKIIE